MGIVQIEATFAPCILKPPSPGPSSEAHSRHNGAPNAPQPLPGDGICGPRKRPPVPPKLANGPRIRPPVPPKPENGNRDNRRTCGLTSRFPHLDRHFSPLKLSDTQPHSPASIDSLHIIVHQDFDIKVKGAKYTPCVGSGIQNLHQDWRSPGSIAGRRVPHIWGEHLGFPSATQNAVHAYQ